MPDLKDLHAVFAELEQLVPDAHRSTVIEQTLAGAGADPAGRRLRRRAMRPAFALAAVVAVAAIAVGAAVLGDAARSGPDDRQRSTPVATAGRSHSGPATHAAAPTVAPSRFASGIPRPAAGTSTTTRLDFAVAPVAGFSFAPLEANRLYQSVEARVVALAHSHDQDVAPGGEIYVFYKGVFDPSGVSRTAPVDVHGHRGWITRASGPTEIAPTSTGTTDAVVWEYAPDSWAEVIIDASAYRAIDRSPGAGNLAIARAVHAAVQPLTLPFRVGYRPSGLHVDGASSVAETAADGTHRGHGTFGLGDARPRATGGPTNAYNVGSALQITVESPLGSSICGSDCTRVRVGRLQVDLVTNRGRVVEVSAPSGAAVVTVSVDSNHLGRFSAAELERTLAGVTVASRPSDPTTWFPAE
jgi:hypothetical protein